MCEDCRKEEGVSRVCWFNVVFGGSYYAARLQIIAGVFLQPQTRSIWWLRKENNWSTAWSNYEWSTPTLCTRTHTHKCSLRQYIMCVSLAVRLRKSLCFQVQRACAGEHPFFLITLTENKLEASSPQNKRIDHCSTCQDVPDMNFIWH